VCQLSCVCQGISPFCDAILAKNIVDTDTFRKKTIIGYSDSVKSIAISIAILLPILFTSAEGGYIFRSVCLLTYLSVCPLDYSRSYERFLMKFFGGVELPVGGGPRTKWLDLGGDPAMDSAKTSFITFSRK